MKTLIILLLASLFAAPVYAQDETLLGDQPLESGWYGAPTIQLTSVNGKAGVLVGGRGGWIINHTVALGFAGYGLANDIEANVSGPDGEPYLDLAYGGFQVEVILQSSRLVHYSLHTLIGGGTVGFRDGWADDHDGYDHRNMDGFFVLEPGANLDVNVTTWFRTSLGVSYRYVSGISSGATTNSDLRGPSGMLSFRFGSF